MSARSRRPDPGYWREYDRKVTVNLGADREPTATGGHSAPRRLTGRGEPGRTHADFDEMIGHLSTLHPSRYGAPVDRLFTTQLLDGGYRKKYLRAASRLVSPATAEAALVSAQP